MTRNKLLFAGLPQSGKTTFVAALWHTIFEYNGDERFQVNFTSNIDNEYLDVISQAWILCEPVPRTSHNPESVSIAALDKVTQKPVLLSIPDLAGEYFARQFISRTWSRRLDLLSSDVKGILLFLNPCDDNAKPRFIYQEQEIYSIFDEQLHSVSASDIVWEAKSAPSQVQLVDFLQAFAFHSRNVFPMRLSLIVSRWDVVQSRHEISPDEWCKNELPLLYQYLHNNSDTYSHKLFGVSAQGGDYSVAKESLLSLPPSERIRVVSSEGVGSAISDPLIWILDES